MKIAVTGSTGLVGSALVPHLRAEGHEVVRLVRGQPRAADEISWDPKGWRVDPAAFAGVGAVVHLAGEPIADGRWTAERKERIRQSRVDGTRFLAQTLAALPEKPALLISFSAVGFYGDRGEEELGEESPVGFGFLSEVCRQWEAAAEPARAAGIRVVHPRLGMVLAAEGGALEKMKLPYKLGLGGPLGSGAQWLPFIQLQDLLKILTWSISQTDLAGPLNAVAPSAIRQRDFAKALGAVLGRPAFLRAPAWALRLAFGELADEMLLASIRARPARLLAAGFEFAFPTADSALRETLGNS